MDLLIKNWSTADWKELLKWAKIGANNAMIGEFAEVEELPSHGALIDMDDFLDEWNELESYRTAMELCEVIPASEEGE